MWRDFAARSLGSAHAHHLGKPRAELAGAAPLAHTLACKTCGVAADLADEAREPRGTCHTCGSALLYSGLRVTGCPAEPLNALYIETSQAHNKKPVWQRLLNSQVPRVLFYSKTGRWAVGRRASLAEGKEAFSMLSAERGLDSPLLCKQWWFWGQPIATGRKRPAAGAASAQNAKQKMAWQKKNSVVATPEPLSVDRVAMEWHEPWPAEGAAARRILQGWGGLIGKLRQRQQHAGTQAGTHAAAGANAGVSVC